jgi:hypothetical protein
MSRVLVVCVLASLLVAMAVAGCEEDYVGSTYINLSNPKDKIVFTSGDTAEITAIVGANLDVWEYGGPATTNFGRQMQQAREAMRQYETVEVTYTVDDQGVIVFEAPGRGTRRANFAQERTQITGLGGRKYVIDD